MSNIAKSFLYEFVKRMPKIELHVHLEGAIRPAMLFELAARNNMSLSAKTEQDLKEVFKFKNFQHFVEIYNLVTGCLKTADDYELISYQFGCECVRQNIHYAEVTFSIFTNCRLTGLPWQKILEALNRGRAKAMQEFDVNWVWIFDILRDEPESQKLILEAILKSKDQGVVGLGLTGSEILFNTENFVKTFETARKNKIGITIHAGEISGPKSIWSVIKRLHADRIGHGVTCIQDSELIKFLKQNKIPLEICPTSNICMGVFPDFKSHPLRKLWDAGLFLTVNSDDPALFGTDLNNEYKILVDHFGFGINDLERISLNGLQASFLPADQKQKLDKSFRVEFADLRKELGI
ncbi:MAG: adenosine deaminase [Candidatus Babeliales bacterium]|jgi:adenosine deaminase